MKWFSPILPVLFGVCGGWLGTEVFYKLTIPTCEVGQDYGPPAEKTVWIADHPLIQFTVMEWETRAARRGKESSMRTVRQRLMGSISIANDETTLQLAEEWLRIEADNLFGPPIPQRQPVDGPVDALSVANGSAWADEMAKAKKGESIP